MNQEDICNVCLSVLKVIPWKCLNLLPGCWFSGSRNLSVGKLRGWGGSWLISIATCNDYFFYPHDEIARSKYHHHHLLFNKQLHHHSLISLKAFFLLLSLIDTGCFLLCHLRGTKFFLLLVSFFVPRFLICEIPREEGRKKVLPCESAPPESKIWQRT